MNNLSSVSYAFTSDFPFVDDIPKREQKKVLSLWDSLAAFSELVKENGPPVSFTLASKLLGISKQSVSQLVQDNRFKIITSPDGVAVITANSLMDFAKEERKAGRPTKLGENLTGKTFLAVMKK